MLSSRTVCARCRHRLLATVAATIVTARPNSTASFPSVAAEPASTTSQPQQAHSPNANPRPSKRKHKNKGGDDGKSRELMDLFESSIKQNEERSAEQQPAPMAIQDINKMHQLASEIAKVLKHEGASACFALMVKEVMPRARAGSGLSQVLSSKAGDALRQIAEIKLAAIKDAELPSLSEICKLNADIGRVKPPMRLQLINRFLEAIVSDRMDESTTEEKLRARERSLDDVVEFWKHLSGLKRTKSGVRYETRFWLNSRPDLRTIDDPARLFWMLLPAFIPNESVGVAPALVTTYVLLTDPAHEQTKARREATPLLEALEPIVKRFDRQKLQPLFENHPELWKYVEPRANWRVIQAASKALKESTAPSAGGPTPRPVKKQFPYALWHKRFNIAYRGNDHAAVQQAWRDLVHLAKDKSIADILRDCPELFDYILHISCHKSRFEQAIYHQVISEVLRYMKSLGLEPTIRTYTSMMEGWKLAKRIEPIEALWQSMTAAGIMLDRHIWSCRISALGKLGKPSDGLRALTQMDRAWQKAVAENTQATAVQPGIANVNAAISGLLSQGRMADVKKVLVWASERELDPDIYTYNMLLSHMLKKGLTKEADKILSGMKDAGITPNGATFTVIIESVFDNLASQSPQEQKAAINNVFDEMAACGIEPNQETYAKMLHTLISEGDIARTSIAAVLSHMRSRNVQPSTEICTILVEYFVSRSPAPDLDSIRALVADRRSRTRALTDRVFWETVVKHYHRAGELDAALEIVYDLDDWGIWPGLALLEPLLRSLAARHDWEGAKKLVATVRRQPRPETTNLDGNSRFWKHGFWAVAMDFDLIGSDGQVL
ncbi:pentatricopeptide repeat domain-containing protein [Colletotrichum karsti]|uniref:Pentatricopeptide repeat domain-containing protein n=1 Tax=Colletotrichum karsti TaxID=1095194 RepID=A0A9P6I2A6_9PEZI|nr:pentatricopeptide repeat domain-containing protein [Colletotrichum karsti]KAF9872706.1 pentatricopeptide repeat domain-containing protein [Colletotrichum karsti]